MRRPSQGHRKAYHRHDISFTMGRAGIAAVQLHLEHLRGGDSGAGATLLEACSHIGYERALDFRVPSPSPHSGSEQSQWRLLA